MANSLLNFEGEFDITLFDEVVQAMFFPKNQQQLMEAQKVLTEFKEHPQAWTRVDTILEKCSLPQAKYIGLQILESLVKYRWKILPAPEKGGIKNYIVGLVIKLSSDAETLEAQKLLLDKLNLLLVQIVKQEWPKNWESFIPDLVNSSRSNESLCINNMRILRLLSEEIFDFSAGEMTSAKIKHMKTSLGGEFSLIFQLCQFVLSESQNPTLLVATLETLYRFLSWIPLGYIFETDLIAVLIKKFFPVNYFRNETLKCLAEIASLTSSEIPAELFVMMFVNFMTQLRQVFLPDTDIMTAYDKGTNSDREFILNLAIFFTVFLKSHLAVVEQAQSDAVLEANYYLCGITLVNNNEVFKVCLEYWNTLTDMLYHEAPLGGDAFPLMLGSKPNHSSQVFQRRTFYRPIMTKVREALVSRMRKPKEILIVEDENGELTREPMPDTANIAVYKQMRETLVFLTNLDCQDTQTIMLNKLTAQCNGSEWSWRNLNTLCWAMGSISGAMSVEEESFFVVTVIKDLLTLCEVTRGKDNKAVIASNIMYIVGQYPRFLLAHWKFLRTVVNKLFEFMHENFPGVQDMACDTFLKIAKKCRHKFVIVHQGEAVGFIEQILTDLPNIIGDLENQQIQTFYEAVGYMISSSENHAQREQLIARFMELPNMTWSQIMSSAASSLDYLRQLETAKSILNILKTNARAAHSLGHSYVFQLGRIYGEALSVYKAYSECISSQVAAQGVKATYRKEIKTMRAVKKETLRLIETFVRESEDDAMIINTLLPPLLEAVLDDYKSNIGPARDPEVLSLMATIVNRVKGDMTDYVPRVFDSVFECTLEMITQNFEDFPDHRVNFFKLLKAINKHCFQSFFMMNENYFSLVIDSIVWAFKHTMRDVADTGLRIMLELWKNVSHSSVAIPFVQRFYMSILQDIFFVLTDRLHKSGFKLQAQILKEMVTVVERGLVEAPLFDPATQPKNMTNQLYLRQQISTMLADNFKNLNSQQVKLFVEGLLDLRKDVAAFKSHLRDFLVQLKEFSGEEDLDLLYLEEKEKMENEKKEEMMKRNAAIPGMVQQEEGEGMEDDI